MTQSAIKKGLFVLFITALSGAVGAFLGWVFFLVYMAIAFEMMNDFALNSFNATASALGAVSIILLFVITGFVWSLRRVRRNHKAISLGEQHGSIEA